MGLCPPQNTHAHKQPINGWCFLITLSGWMAESLVEDYPVSSKQIVLSRGLWELIAAFSIFFYNSVFDLASTKFSLPIPTSVIAPCLRDIVKHTISAVYNKTSRWTFFSEQQWCFKFVTKKADNEINTC